jgi:uridine kinase
VHVQPVLDLIAAAETHRGFTLVGIGGRGGAGKSTLAGLIPTAQVVGTDEFWDGSEFELSRLRQEVVEPLLEGAVARFHAFDWDAAREAPAVRVVRPEGIVVVEGVCALHRMFRHAYDVRVWVDTPRELRLERGVARDGEGARERWETVWMPSEERYIERDDPIPSAHVVVDGSGAAAAPA